MSEPIVKAEPGDAIISSATNRILLNVNGVLREFKEGTEGPEGPEGKEGKSLKIKPWETHETLLDQKGASGFKSENLTVSATNDAFVMISLLIEVGAKSVTAVAAAENSLGMGAILNTLNPVTHFSLQTKHMVFVKAGDYLKLFVELSGAPEARDIAEVAVEDYALLE